MLFPAYFAALSVILLVLHGVWLSKPVQKLLARARPSRKPAIEEATEVVVEEAPQHNGLIADLKNHINAKGGPVIFFYKVLRLVGCLALVGLTIATLVIDEHDRESSFIETLKKKKKKKKHASASDSFTELEWLHVALCLTYVRCRLSKIYDNAHVSVDVRLIPCFGFSFREASLGRYRQCTPCLPFTFRLGGLRVP